MISPYPYPMQEPGSRAKRGVADKAQKKRKMREFAGTNLRLPVAWTFSKNDKCVRRFPPDLGLSHTVQASSFQSNSLVMAAQSWLLMYGCYILSNTPYSQVAAECSWLFRTTQPTHYGTSGCSSQGFSRLPSYLNRSMLASTRLRSNHIMTCLRTMATYAQQRYVYPAGIAAIRKGYM